jgi:hypothetical protein
VDPPETRNPIAGDRLAGRYRLRDQVAEAEWDDSHRESRLWKATDELLRRPVTVRVLPPGARRTPAVLAAARAASRLTDHRLARIYDVVADDGLAYVVSEWPPGDPLDDLLTDGPLDAVTAATIVVEAAEALAAAHAAGLGHLRLNPGSVRWDPKTGLKITGVGIDAALSGARLDDGPATDTRGLARLLYAAVTARWPEPDARGVPAAPRRRGQAYPPRCLRAAVPGALDRVVTDALLTPDRPRCPTVATPEHLAAALAAFLRSQPLAGAEADPPDAPPGRLAGRLLIANVTAFLAVLLGGGLWASAQHSGQTTVGPTPAPSAGQQPARLAPAAARALTPVRASTFQLSGPGEGRPALAIDRDPATVWRSHWYTTTRFGNLKNGLGLLVDMGTPVTVSRIHVGIADAAAADFQLRIGDTVQRLADLRAVAVSATAAHATELSVAPPAAARYVLLWFTGLPPQANGSDRFQAAVRDLTVYGSP